MKKITLILSILISINAFCNATDTIQINSKITDVTVFFNGAQITRLIDLNANKGKHIIVVDKLPQEINPQSVQVKGIANCKILSVKHQLDINDNKKKSEKELKVEDKIQLLEIKYKENNNKLIVFNYEENLLLKNSILRKSNEGTIVSEIREGADFYRQRLNEIKRKKLNLITEKEKIKKEIKKLQFQLHNLTIEKRKTYSKIVITLDCEKYIATDMIMSYYIKSAGWNPIYDFRVNEISKPLEISYNAKIFQSSGEKWDNVNIKLSANNPSLSGEKPELLSWYLDKGSPYHTKKIKKGIGCLKGRVIESNSNIEIPFANIIISKNNKNIGGTVSDIDGNYTIKPIPSGYYDIKATFVGYHPYEMTNVLISSNKITFVNIELVSGLVELDDVIIVEYQTKLADFSSEKVEKKIESYDNEIEEPIFIKEPKQKPITKNYISNSLNTNITNLEYSIDIPYTIPSDGEDYSIKIKEVTLPVEYVYYAIPKLDDDIFLTAEITDWTKLNLLSGKINIYYQGTYTGKSFIDANNSNDTLSVSLGREKNIILTREQNKEMNDKRIIGNNIIETINWDITIKNNKTKKIKIIIEDQYPISERKSIDVELLESSDAEINKKTGMLIWEIELEENEKKIIPYKYSVKYPNYFNLNLE